MALGSTTRTLLGGKQMPDWNADCFTAVCETVRDLRCLITLWASTTCNGDILKNVSTNRTTAACQRSHYQLLLIERCRIVSAADPLRP
jgi:hypothetical protein